jgi:small-conductance mechanosensitive channel
LLIIISVLWLIMFIVNLNIYDPIKKAILQKLNTPVNIGNAAFTPAGIFLFFVIIWIAHLLQRYTGYIFGDIGFDDDEEIENKEQRSKMLISKLLILTISYFLAVAASGLPVDKITIVLGALGVGIGLGLQNIVTNFISGIILIFDRPLQIGDSIEVGDKAGKVKEIVMRSSTLLTPEGAEVIIPNGDILSQQITNWTLSNNYRRLDMTLNLKTTKSKDEVLPVVTEIIKSSALAHESREPIALIDTIKEGEMGLKIYFWCNDIYKADLVKSELRYLLYTRLREQDIQVG